MTHDPIIREGWFHKREVHALGGLRFARGNDKPYFCLTMASWQHMPSGRKVEDVFGAAHEELVRYWPELKPLADLHLSYIDGVPMHAESNGWYWLAGAAGGLGEQFHGGNGTGGKTESECLDVLGRHLRISDPLVARGLAVAVLDVANERGNKVARAMFKDYVLLQKDRWKHEAEECIKALDLKVFGDPWPAEIEETTC